MDKKLLLKIISCILIMYLGVSFANWELNAKLWHHATRFIFTFFVFIYLGVTFGIKFLNEDI